MSANPKNAELYTLDEYFALEHAGDARYEYWNGEIVCMSGGSPEHGQIVSNVHYRLRQKLEGGRCRAYTGDQAVKTDELRPYRYPDASAVCGEPTFETIRSIGALTNPVLIVEVLSPVTAVRDHEDKFTAYKAIFTFREYLLISQEAPQVIQYTKQPNGDWLRHDVTGLDGSLLLSSIGCTLALTEVYEFVKF